MEQDGWSGHWLPEHVASHPCPMPHGWSQSAMPQEAKEAVPMIRAETAFDVARPPADVFTMIDDVRRVPEWLSQCAELQQTTPGPKGMGSSLLYRYQEGGPRTGTMEGTVTAWEKDRRLEM